jgi:hypothetical protein
VGHDSDVRGVATIAAITLWLLYSFAAQDHAPRFELVQPDTFAVPGAMPNAWADFDSDGQATVSATSSSAFAARRVSFANIASGQNH